jgi:hypothetical protein
MGKKILQIIVFSAISGAMSGGLQASKCALVSDNLKPECKKCCNNEQLECVMPCYQNYKVSQSMFRSCLSACENIKKKCVKEICLTN